MTGKQKIFKSREVNVGDLTLGGDNPVLVQTMTNTPTADVKKTVSQIKRIVNAGSNIVRLAVSSMEDVRSIPEIKKKLQEEGVFVPLVADIHYSPRIAEHSARFVEKVRINPGNFIAEKLKKHYSEHDFALAREQLSENISPLLKICRQYGTALRIGVNWGSLSKRVLYRYGNTPEGMVASAMEFMDVLQDENFENFTLSLKASDVRVMHKANVLLVKKMIEQDRFFPLHLGVTEAGEGVSARVKSAAGIGVLLKLGIGDTVRVSLTEDPVNEIPVAELLVQLYGQKKGAEKAQLDKIDFKYLHFSSSIKEKTGHDKPLIFAGKPHKQVDVLVDEKKYFVKGEPVNPIDEKLIISEINDDSSFDRFLIISSTGFAFDFLTTKANALFLKNERLTQEQLIELSQEILQALGFRYSKPEYIACPSCGRTRFVIFEQLQRVKEKTSHLKGVKIAVMGCPVNGPGEMADADYGYVGTGKGKVTIYKHGKPYKKNVPEENAVDVLVEVIEKDRADKSG